MTTTETQAPALPALITALHEIEAERATAARHVAEAEADRHATARAEANAAHAEMLAAYERDRTIPFATHPHVVVPPEGADEKAARKRLRELERGRDAAIASLAASVAPAARELLERLTVSGAVLTDARTAADNAELRAEKAEADAMAASTGPEAGAADDAAETERKAARMARRRVVALEAQHAEVLADLRRLAPEARQAAQHVAQAMLRDAEGRFRAATARAHGALAEAFAVGVAAGLPDVGLLTRIALPASFLAGDAMPPIADLSGQHAPELGKTGAALTDLVAVVRELEHASRAEPAPVAL